MKVLISIFFKKILDLTISINSDKLFCSILNIRFILLGKKDRIKSRISNGQKYIAISDTVSKLDSVFINKRLGYNSYHNGLKDRLLQIGESTYMFNLVDFRDEDLVLDIGANLGDVSMYFRVKKINVRYIGFEPSKSEYKCLRMNIKQDSTEKVFQVALGNKTEQMTFYSKPDNGDSSLIKMLDFSDKYEIQVKTLDQQIEELGLQNAKIKLLKLEAEGFEPEIIQGYNKYLSNVEYVVADLGPERGNKAELTSPEVINYLLNRNFEIINQTLVRNVFLFRAKNSKN